MTRHAVAMPRRGLLAGAIGTVVAAATAAPQPAAAAEPAAPRLVDSHVHFYDPQRPEGVPWPARDDAVLYRTVLPEEWERLVAPLATAAAIVVEASPWVEDNQWLLDLAARGSDAGPGIVGVVGNLPLGDAACGGLVERFGRNRLFRGVRVHGDKLLAGLGDRAFAADVGRLVDRGLSIDVNGGDVFGAAVDVTDRFPAARVVIDHMGNTPVTAAGPAAGWLAQLARVGDRPGCFMKVSGLAESAVRSLRVPRAPVDHRRYEPWLDAAWRAFGPRRLMYGSNWPVSDKAAAYADVHGIVAPFVRDRGAEAERWFYVETSRQAYRWT